jgi:hypothetical protein
MTASASSPAIAGLSGCRFRLSVWIRALALAVLVFGGGLPVRAETLLDYLVQQVCDDGAGGHTAEDPVTCPTRARKLRVGESLPYHKWDIASGPGQISDSYPIADLQGRLRVVHTFFFNDTRDFRVPVFDLADPATGRTGYDLSLADGTYVSFAGTYDPGRGWQPMWSDSFCELADSWVIGSRTQTVPFSFTHTVTTLNTTSPQCPPNPDFGTSYTGWNYYPGVRYESGKLLDTIKTWHFNGPTINASGIEQFYFTKEYGKTRWEAWSSQVPGPSAVAVTRCPSHTAGGVSVFGSTTYYLTDCHDWSFIHPSPAGDWDPAVHWHVDPLYYSVNLLANTHMQCTDSEGVSGFCGALFTCRTTEPWNRIGNLMWSFDPNIQAPHDSVNCALRFAIPSGPSGQSVYQDIAGLPFGFTDYTFGTALWSPSGATLSATIRLYQLDGTRVVAFHDIPATIDGTRRVFKGSFTLSSSTTWLRFEVYPRTVNQTYVISESWVAPEP